VTAQYCRESTIGIIRWWTAGPYDGDGCEVLGTSWCTGPRRMPLPAMWGFEVIEVAGIDAWMECGETWLASPDVEPGIEQIGASLDARGRKLKLCGRGLAMLATSGQPNRRTGYGRMGFRRATFACAQIDQLCEAIPALGGM